MWGLSRGFCTDNPSVRTTVTPVLTHSSQEGPPGPSWATPKGCDTAGGASTKPLFYIIVRRGALPAPSGLSRAIFLLRDKKMDKKRA